MILVVLICFHGPFLLYSSVKNIVCQLGLFNLCLLFVSGRSFLFCSLIFSAAWVSSAGRLGTVVKTSILLHASRQWGTFLVHVFVVFLC